MIRERWAVEKEGSATFDPFGLNICDAAGPQDTTAALLAGRMMIAGLVLLEGVAWLLDGLHQAMAGLLCSGIG